MNILFRMESHKAVFVFAQTEGYVAFATQKSGVATWTILASLLPFTMCRQVPNSIKTDFLNGTSNYSMAFFHR